MKEAQIVQAARGWVGLQMNWAPQSSGRSTLGPVLHGQHAMPASGLTPSNQWTLVCYEMPLLAALNVKALTWWYTKKVVSNPDYYLKGHGLTRYDATHHPVAGDLVFWKGALDPNSLFARAFGGLAGGGASTDLPFGLDHVALATGQNARNGHAEVISFWQNNQVEATDVGTISQHILTNDRSTPSLDVTYAHGPWYWGYYVW